MTALLPGRPRTARVERRTAEVSVTVQLDLDGTGDGGSDTGLPFLDHMLAQLGKHARFDLGRGQGRPGGRRPPHRRGHRHRHRPGTGRGPGRQVGGAPLRRPSSPSTRPGPGLGRPVRPPLPGLGRRGRRRPGRLGSFDPRQARHLMEALVANARCTIHVQLEAGDLPHHCLEACFKALARAHSATPALPTHAPAPAAPRGSWDDRRRWPLDYGVGNLHPRPRRWTGPGPRCGWCRRSPRPVGRRGWSCPGSGRAGPAWTASPRPAGRPRSPHGSGAGPCSASASACSCCSRPARKARSATASGSSPARSGALPAT